MKILLETKDRNAVVNWMASVMTSKFITYLSLFECSNEEMKDFIIERIKETLCDHSVHLGSGFVENIGNILCNYIFCINCGEGEKDGTYRIIYECIEEIKAAMKGLLAPTFKEVLLGHIEVRQTIKVPGVGVIAGSYVQDGKVTRQSQIRIVRDGIVIMEDKISSLRRFKDDVREVAAGYECGIGLEKCLDIQVGDILEAYVMEEVER